MATVKLDYKQKRESVIIDGVLKYRVTTYITDLYDESTGNAIITNPPDGDPTTPNLGTNAPLFLLKKINLYQEDGVTAPELVKQSEYIRVATPQDFQETDPTEFSYTSSASDLTWLGLYNTGDIRYSLYDGTGDSSLVEAPANAKVDQAEYYISNIIVEEYDYIEDADTAAENTRLALQIFKERLNDFINNIYSTMNDGTEYPSGWASYTI